MDDDTRTMQWELSVQIWHSRDAGHELTATIYAPGRRSHEAGDWRWKGLGLDPGLVRDIATRLEAVVVEHLISRYGITGMTDLRWAGEPDPF
jgi:hypothetical protein